MAFVYKTILRFHNKEYILQQAKASSRRLQVIQHDRKDPEAEGVFVAEIDNKTNKVEYFEELPDRVKYAIEGVLYA